jgi:hypothetical protein
VFAGFSVYSKQAQNFVIRTTGGSSINLQLATQSDFSDATATLSFPISGSQTHFTFDTREYDSTVNYKTDIIPNDIALRTPLNGVTTGLNAESNIAFIAFSFYLINYSDHTIDVEFAMNVDTLSYSSGASDYHVDDALRVMVIQGESLLTDNNYTIYAKAEHSEEDKAALYEDADKYGEYYQTTDWVNDHVIFERAGSDGIENLANGESVKFTIILWLEGRDVACVNSIYGEMAKLSMDFVGY